MNTKPFDAYFGRGGDTELRDVGGVESHVNSFEAHLIDKYGEFGESIVKKIGSGTVNPTTGKPEYFIDLLLTILAVGAPLVAASGNWPGSDSGSSSGDEFWRKMGYGSEASWKQDLQNKGTNFMGSDSSQPSTYGGTKQSKLSDIVNQMGSSEYGYANIDVTDRNSIIDGLLKGEFMQNAMNSELDPDKLASVYTTFKNERLGQV